MKMTMHIDEKLLARVMKNHGFTSKTEAVAKGLAELDRRSRLMEIAKRGLSATPEQLKASVYPDYDIHALRVAEMPVPYGKKNVRPRSR